MSNPAIAPFLEQLRSATSQSHTALEALPVSVSIMNPEVTNEQYSLYLDLMHDVVKDAEENVFPLLSEIIPDLLLRYKTAMLEADLQTLGYTKATFQKPLSIAATNLTPAFALGIMYVVEGSSLGGRIILKNINTALGHNEESGARYFSGYGGQTGSQWRNFLGMLSQYAEQTSAEEEIIKGANYAFNAISNHFSQNVAR